MANETTTQRERTLGRKEALMSGVGTMVDAGIFVLPGAVAAMAGPASSAAFYAVGFGNDVDPLMASLDLNLGTVARRSDPR